MAEKVTIVAEAQRDPNGEVLTLRAGGTTVHTLKTHPAPFNAVLSGEKTFEFRLNDRDFQVGDYLNLCEWCPEKGEFTGRQVCMRVGYALYGGFGIPDGYCIMSILPCETAW